MSLLLDNKYTHIYILYPTTKGQGYNDECYHDNNNGMQKKVDAAFCNDMNW